MPRLSYPNAGRVASARVKEDLDGDKSNSIKLVDQAGDTHPELETPDVRAQAKPEQDDASVAFQKQIDALKESERIQRERAEQYAKEREDAIKRANERETEIHQLKKTTIDSRVETVSASLAAAQSAAESAQRDLEKAFELGDFKGQAEATNRLSRAHADISSMESGKAELEAEAKAAAEVKVEPQSTDPLDKFNLPPLAKSWLRDNPEYLTNLRKNALIQKLHYDIVDDEGLEPYSRPYFESLEQHLRTREQPQEQNDEQEDQQRSRSMSAPVSRELPTSHGNQDRSGRITLSVAQKEAAKIAGATEKEYAEGLIKLREEKKNGNYGGQQ